MTPTGEPGRLVSTWGLFSRPAVRVPNGNIWMLTHEGQWHETTVVGRADLTFLPDPPEGQTCVDEWVLACQHEPVCETEQECDRAACDFCREGEPCGEHRAQAREDAAREAAER